MTINEASALRDEIVECFDTYEGLILDLNGVSEFDVAGIQLLCSARLTAQSTDKRFQVTNASMASIDTLFRAGFDPDEIFAAA